jgi:hypothetical protein
MKHADVKPLSTNVKRGVNAEEPCELQYPAKYKPKMAKDVRKRRKSSLDLPSAVYV